MGSTAWVAGSVGLAAGMLAGWWLGTPEADAPLGDTDVSSPLAVPSVPMAAGAPAEAASASPRLQASDVSASAAARARGAALGLDGRVRGLPAELPELFEAALRARYAGEVPDAALADEEVQAQIADLPESLDRIVGEGVQKARWRAHQLQRHPLLGEKVELILQVAGLTQASTALHDRSSEAQAPLELTQPRADGRERDFVRGGVIPPGRALLLEEVVLRVLPTAGGSAACELELDTPSHGQVRAGVCALPHRSLYRGRLVIDEGREGRIRLSVKRGSAEAVLRGRLVDRATRSSHGPASLELVEREGDGLLEPEQILLQVMSGHSGGNSCTLHLNGETNGYVTDRRPTSVWEEPSGREQPGQGRYHVRGAGALPPGKVFEITRVVYRGWVTPTKRGNGSRVEVHVGGTSILNPTSTTESEFQGVWTGSELIRAGYESSVRVTAGYYACVEARIEGRLVDASALGPDGKLTR